VVQNGAIFWMDPDSGPSAGSDGETDATLAQLTLPTAGPGGQMHFDAQGNSINGLKDWEEHCIEIQVGGPNSGAGSHAGPGAVAEMLPVMVDPETTAECPFVADGTCDEGTGKGARCPPGTDTADCLGAECLSVDTEAINGACARSGAQAAGMLVPDKCTQSCAVVYTAWWQRCSGAVELQQADAQEGGALSAFAAKCDDARSGH